MKEGHRGCRGQRDGWLVMETPEEEDNGEDNKEKDREDNKKERRR